MISIEKIYDLLYSLGITANYTGFFQLAYAVKLCAEQPERLLLVTKCVYPDVAKMEEKKIQAPQELELRRVL